jgi:hypothetical protein
MVKCSDCGLLALVPNVRFDLIEADPKFRETGYTGWREIGGTYEWFPICAVDSFDLEAECEQLHSSMPGFLESEAVKAIIQKERPCGLMTRWRKGFSPKEHRELLDIQMDRDWREQRFREGRVWRDEQARLDREWRTEEAKDRRKANRYLLCGVIVAAIMPIMAIILGNLLISDTLDQVRAFEVGVVTNSPAVVFGPFGEFKGQGMQSYKAWQEEQQR